MNKTQTIKKATKKTRAQNRKNFWKKLAKFPGNVCRKLWNWLKEINVVGMVNLTLLVAIIVLFSCLISNFMCCKQNATKNSQDHYLNLRPKIHAKLLNVTKSMLCCQYV